MDGMMMAIMITMMMMLIPMKYEDDSELHNKIEKEKRKERKGRIFSGSLRHNCTQSRVNFPFYNRIYTIFIYSDRAEHFYFYKATRTTEKIK